MWDSLSLSRILFYLHQDRLKAVVLLLHVLRGGVERGVQGVAGLRFGIKSEQEFFL